MACHCHYSISKSPYPRMVTALLNSTKSQPRNLYLSTINPLFPPNPKSNLSQRTKTHRDRCSSHLNTFDDILRLNDSIEQPKRPQNPERNPQPANTEWSYMSRTFLNDSITGSLLVKKTSRYALPTNPTRSDEPYPTLPRSANALVRQMPYL